jgi:hypothetical protein
LRRLLLLGLHRPSPPPRQVHTYQLTTTVSAARFGVHRFAAHASVNSPLERWVLEGEWCRLQNVVPLALTLR